MDEERVWTYCGRITRGWSSVCVCKRERGEGVNKEGQETENGKT